MTSITNRSFQIDNKWYTNEYAPTSDQYDDNGSTWKVVQSTPALFFDGPTYIREVAYSPEIKVLVAIANTAYANSTNIILRSIDNGKVWTPQTCPSNNWVSIVWNIKNRRFVATSNNNLVSDNIMWSSDGITWTLVTGFSYLQSSWTKIIYISELSRLVVIGSGPNSTTTERSMFSTDSNSFQWQIAPTPAINLNWVDVAWSPKLHLLAAVSNSGNTGGNGIMTSVNGESWTSRTHNSLSTLLFSSIVWDAENSVFIAFAKGPYGFCIKSTNGVNWIEVSLYQPNLLGLPDTSGFYKFSAESTTFTGYVERTGDGKSWLLVGRGRENWVFDIETGAGDSGNVINGLGTAAAFVPATYTSSRINALITQNGTGPYNLTNVEIRLKRASSENGSTYQEDRWRPTMLTTWRWDFDVAGYQVEHEILSTLGDPISGSISSYVTNTFDTYDGFNNDGKRIFTWAWVGHNSIKGFSYGSGVTSTMQNFLWQYTNENHSIPYTEVYIRINNDSVIPQEIHPHVAKAVWCGNYNKTIALTNQINYALASNGATASATSVYPNILFLASSAINGLLEEDVQQNYWLSQDGVTVAELTIDLGELRTIRTISLVNCRNYIYNDRGTKDYRLAVSTNNVSYTIISSGTLPPYDRRKRVITTFAPINIRYVRFYMDNIYGVGGGLSEIQVTNCTCILSDDGFISYTTKLINTVNTSITWIPELNTAYASGEVIETFEPRKFNLITDQVSLSKAPPFTITTTGVVGGDMTDIEWSPELGLFAAADGGNARIITSRDGTTWSVQDGLPLKNYVSIAWSSTLKIFAAIAAVNDNPNAAVTWDSFGTVTIGTTPTGTSGYWRKCVWGHELGMFVAVANSGGTATQRAMYSYDGVTWNFGNTPNLDRVYWDVVYSPKLKMFAAFSYITNVSDGIITSTDGINWTMRSHNGSSSLEMVAGAWSPELGIFVGMGYTQYEGVYSYDGITWTSFSIPRNLIYGGCWSPNLQQFIFVSITGGYTLTSSDGINWDDSTPATNGMRSVVWSETLNSAVATCAIGVFEKFEVIPDTQTDYLQKLTWQGETNTLPGSYQFCLTWSPELNILVVGGNGGIQTSPNGLSGTWTFRGSPGSITAGCWSPRLKLFVISLQQDSNAIYTSVDGITWTVRVTPTDSGNHTWKNIAWSEELGIFVVVDFSATSTNTTRAMYSTDGVNWFHGSTPAVNRRWYGLTYSSKLKMFCATSYGTNAGGDGIMTSTNGINWTMRTHPGTSNLDIITITWSSELGMFAAAGWSVASEVLYSYNGINWVSVALSYNRWTGSCWSDELRSFIFVSDLKRAMYSSDGKNWTVTNEQNQTMQNVLWISELKRAIAVGDPDPLNVMSFENKSGALVGIVRGTERKDIVVDSNNSVFFTDKFNSRTITYQVQTEGTTSVYADIITLKEYGNYTHFDISITVTATEVYGMYTYKDGYALMTTPETLYVVNPIKTIHYTRDPTMDVELQVYLNNIRLKLTGITNIFCKWVVRVKLR